MNKLVKVKLSIKQLMLEKIENNRIYIINYILNKKMSQDISDYVIVEATHYSGNIHMGPVGVIKKLQTKVNELLKKGYKLNGPHTMKIITIVHDKDLWYCATQSLYK
jgi:hypothetical protein